ncbi:MAG: putative photosynthetic complex assembly protein PuhE [Erythrobacter sp.]|jgi:putative photosynthetic complex assembly protein 2|uniref:putative photosynthetic complex assembly protein PuhE n=1 Tax=Erythrobacter sp. TaxID=1042 RepID=UPI002B48D9E3|nr:putative photosynthetic complex assembly protein PuhE [Erythrobacter sp.]WRH71747.1 MAG: putative photosynthetic complex assembly protein PuhE [Erythrobacter sp.]
MVSWSGHIVPFMVTVAIWFIATGLIAWADNRERTTFSRSLMIGSVAGIAGLIVILFASLSAEVWAVYLAFCGALMVWGWHELSFLTGAAAGPRRGLADPRLTGMARFRQAAATMMHHEVALAVTALLLISLSWNVPNQIGATVFVLMFAMRLISKINLFVGVPNSTAEMLPDHLAYLKTYFGPNRMTRLLIMSIAVLTGVTIWFAALALAAPLGSAEMVGASLLTTLALLGVLEHLFLALPFRDGMLWGWALPKRAPARTNPNSRT